MIITKHLTSDSATEPSKLLTPGGLSRSESCEDLLSEIPTRDTIDVSKVHVDDFKMFHRKVVWAVKNTASSVLKTCYCAEMDRSGGAEYVQKTRNEKLHQFFQTKTAEGGLKLIGIAFGTDDEPNGDRDYALERFEFFAKRSN